MGEKKKRYATLYIVTTDLKLWQIERYQKMCIQGEFIEKFVTIMWHVKGLLCTERFKQCSCQTYVDISGVVL